ncbi:uncharacterized protein N7525_005063 [Penicillium rubens]|uniref:uncharacterized protein n=1 Tax=Penicillium rubens TaxID=1108849 RepID=UPI002A5A695C|nr:uncharacterized protein N7525_005063 [Penicillium rubens]KAJ5839875.1 hypothetical protein N7525_005063 [Penicillium rubens]
MEGLSSAASVIAVIQLTGIIVNILVNICGGYVQEVKEARDDIITLQRTVAGLEEILQKLKGLLQDSNVDSTKLPSSSSPRDTEKKINPGTGQNRIRRFGFRALKWRSNALRWIIRDLERYKSSFTLSLQVGHSIILANVARKAEDIRHDFSLDKLLVAHRAEFDSYIDQHEDQHEDECLLGTRTELLRKITE